MMQSIISSILAVLFLCTPASAGLTKRNSGESRTEFHSRLTVLAQNNAKEELEFVQSEAYKSKDGKNFHVKGTVRNISRSLAVKKITVTVIIYDKENKELETKTVPLNPDVLKPGQEGTFEVVTKYNDKMHGYQKTVKWKMRRW